MSNENYYLQAWEVVDSVTRFVKECPDDYEERLIPHFTRLLENTEKTARASGVLSVQDESFRYLQKDSWQVAEDHGWHGYKDDGEPLQNLVEKLCLIHAEVSEALEEYRDGHAPDETYYGDDGKPEGVPIEIADVIIRCMDLAETWKVDLCAAVQEKQRFNRTRPFRHGGKKL